MISFDDDQDPLSCDHKKFKFNSDDIDLFNSLAAADLDKPHHPSFSIRGYVSDSRSKDIASSWPFSDKTLQICLQNGVTKLLPPFQSLESLRNNSPNDESVSNSCGKSNVNELKSNLDLTLIETKSKKTSLVSTKKTDIKKCRIKLKVNMSVEPIKEVPPMSSKVCPVCKTFSSSSNTTLNAHIDQCLSGESSMKWTANPGESSMKWTANPKVTVKQHSIKPRIKPRKMRMMVDIYKTATHSTVEELDARNGISWANNSSFPDQELKFQEEEDEEATVNVPRVADHEGAVYIDTNGTKVRILSVPKAVSDDREAQKLLKQGKFGKTLMGKKTSKNLDLDKHQHKSLKLSQNSKKPSSAVTVGLKENVAIEQNRKKEDRGKAPMKPEVRMSKDEMPIVRPPWACSKRTVLAKKLCENIHSRIDATRNLSTTASDRSLSESGLSIPSCSSSKTGIPSQKVSKKMGTSPLAQYAKKISPKLTTPSQLNHSKGSNGSNFSSLLSVNKEPATKINLKRKFTALTESCEGPSQDSLEQQSLFEEDTSGKLSSESRNLLEVDEPKIFTPEISVASLSSNGDPSCDVEFACKETLSYMEQINTIHVPREIGVAGIFMNLSNSEEGNDDKETYCAYSVNESLRIDDVTDDIEMKKNYFHVDPIQVPEPRGSFFPTLGTEMVTEEHHTNSSLVDRDSMSDSPISTISNPTLGRSNSDKFSVRSSTSLKDDTIREMVDAINAKYATNSGDWRSMHMADFKNDHQPCCCSRKEGVTSQTVAASYQESTLLRKNASESFNFKPQMFSGSNSSQPPISLSPSPPVAENTACLQTSTSPLIPVLRLMGKNLTVAKTDENVTSPQQCRSPHPQVSPIGQFPYVQNEYSFSTLGYHHQYQNGYQPPNNLTNHALDAILQSNSYVDYGSPRVGPMIPETRKMHAPPSNPIKEVIIIDDSPEEETRNWPSSHSSIPAHNRNIHNHMPCGYESHNSLRFSNGSFQAHSPFMKVEDTRNHGSSRSSAIYYPPGYP